MNQVLDVAGNFLYIALSVVLFPVFMLFDVVMGAWLLARWSRKYSKVLLLRFTHKHATYQLRVKKAMVLTRAKLNNTAH
jgi:hypothetical protein